MAETNTGTPEEIALIAGRGAYPLLLARSARTQGVKRICALAFKRETDKSIEKLADEVRWINLGKLQQALDVVRDSGVRHAVMAGQITPRHLFSLRMDSRLLALMSRLKARNADTIFGACADELKSIGVELLPAHVFMEDCMPGPGVLGARRPTESEENDISLGIRVARMTSGLEIGQTVVVKHGTILAVEAFEGTDKAIRRGGKLGGAGSVVVKVAREGHDMRFDIPVVGSRTFKMLKKARASVLAVEAGRTILLEREKLVSMADSYGMAFISVEVNENEKE